jgi:hypothetical protein
MSHGPKKNAKHATALETAEEPQENNRARTAALCPTVGRNSVAVSLFVYATTQ